MAYSMFQTILASFARFEVVYLHCRSDQLFNNSQRANIKPSMRCSADMTSRLSQQHKISLKSCLIPELEANSLSIINCLLPNLKKDNSCNYFNSLIKSQLLKPHIHKNFSNSLKTLFYSKLKLNDLRIGESPQIT